MNGTGSPRERLPLGLLIVLTGALLALARPLPVPEAARAVCALAAVFLVPGAALALLWPGVSRHGWTATAGLALPLSLVPVLGASAFGWAVHWPPLALGAAYLFGTFVVVLASLVRAWTRDPGDHPGRTGNVVLGLLLAAGFLVLLRAGAPTGAETDGPDHVATVNEILQSGDPFPRQALVPAGTVDRTDPRKGIFHVGLALAAALADCPAATVWAMAPAVLFLSWFPLVHLLGRRLGLGPAGAILAAALAFMYLGGSAGAWGPRIGYGSHLSLVLAWAGLWTLLGLVREFEAPTVLLFAVLTAAAAAVHPMAPAFLFLPTLLVLVLARDESATPFLRVAGALGVALAVAAPVLAWRVLEVQGPVNPLHGQTMPVLDLGPVSVLWPGAGARQLGVAGVAGLLLAPWSGRWVGTRWGGRMLPALALAAVITAFVPGLFDVAARWASSLPIKLLGLDPFPWVLAALLTSAWKGRGVGLRLAVGLLLLAALPGAAAAFSPARVAGWRPPGMDRAEALLRDLGGPHIVAADPWVSYIMAAETAQEPLTVYHQHGHPLDPDGLSRLDDLDAVLSPWVDADSTARILFRYHSRFVLLPEPRGLPPRVGFGAARGGELDSLRLAKFEAVPWAFPVEARAPGWVLFRAAHSGAPGGPLPPRRAATGPPRGRPVSAADGEAAGVRLVSVEIPQRLVAGERTPLVLWWKRTGAPAGWPVEVHLRVISERAPASSILGRYLGRILGRAPATPERYRLSTAPFLGAWPPDRWPLGEVVADTLQLALPGGFQQGSCRISARVLPRSLFPELSLGDLLGSVDRWQGASLGNADVSATGGGVR